MLIFFYPKDILLFWKYSNIYFYYYIEKVLIEIRNIIFEISFYFQKIEFLLIDRKVEDNLYIL